MKPRKPIPRISKKRHAELVKYKEAIRCGAKPSPLKWMKKRKPIAKISPKRKIELAFYTKSRREYLAMHPYCALEIWRHALSELEVIQNHGVVVGADNQIIRIPLATEVHHKAGRIGNNYLNQETWAALCSYSHLYIHANPSWARANGWLV